MTEPNKLKIKLYQRKQLLNSNKIKQKWSYNNNKYTTNYMNI